MVVDESNCSPAPLFPCSVQHSTARFWWAVKRKCRECNRRMKKEEGGVEVHDSGKELGSGQGRDGTGRGPERRKKRESERLIRAAAMVAMAVVLSTTLHALSTATAAAAGGAAGIQPAAVGVCTLRTVSTFSQRRPPYCALVFAAGQSSVAPEQSSAWRRRTVAMASSAGGAETKVEKSEEEWRAVLSPEQFRILRRKGTEYPGTGEYNKHYDEGVYECAGCGTALYKSTTKFDSGCGWPAFFEGIPGAINETRDADGSRVEITCAACGGHLGHVFKGEGFKTPTNARHCVNSVSLKFTPANR